MTHYFYIIRDSDGMLRPQARLATPGWDHKRLFSRSELDRLMDIVEKYKTSTLHYDDIRERCIMELDGKLVFGEQTGGAEGSWI